LESIIAAQGVHKVVFAYSDVSHEVVMQRASRSLAAGSDFCLLGPRPTMIRARRPVISICATKTGSGKSPAARKCAEWLKKTGRRVAVIRHPMPYGDLTQQAVQRFATLEDLDKAACRHQRSEHHLYD
jgi:predicted GTPase